MIIQKMSKEDTFSYASYYFVIMWGGFGSMGFGFVWIVFSFSLFWDQLPVFYTQGDPLEACPGPKNQLYTEFQ